MFLEEVSSTRSLVSSGRERQRETEGYLCAVLPRAGVNGRPDMRLEAVDSHALFYERKLVSLELRKPRQDGQAREAQTSASGTHA